MDKPFQVLTPAVHDNAQLRTPQREVYERLVSVAHEPEEYGREVSIVLPVGCGKSGCITLAPFAFRATRVLVVAPGVKIARQLHDDFDPANPYMFYQKCKVLAGPTFPEPAEIRGTTGNHTDLEEAHVVVTNIQQLQGAENRWLQDLPDHFFDLILVDEGHHNVAQSWEAVRSKFAAARIVNFSATPQRADGRNMEGPIVYSYPVFRAIQEGYVKRLKAVVLNPSTLRYVRREGDTEVEIDLDEVRRLGAEEADFRRSIVTSAETLSTIVDASIRELRKLRSDTGENRLKIIASALNQAHCAQIVEAYRARGLRADYVHSKIDGVANERVMQRLDSHELDVIVQVRQLGEGFDHPYLAVAAVFSIFSNLSPFVQFVGRIMRVIEHDAPGHLLNRGTVVFHAGANIASRWEDFQQFSEADQDYFDQLFPTESVDFSDAIEIAVDPIPRSSADRDRLHVSGQSGVHLEEIPLLSDDPDALRALETLREKGYTSEELTRAYEQLEPVPVTKQRQRRAMRAALDQKARAAAGRILAQRSLNPAAYDLDHNRLGRTNYVVVKSAIDRAVNAFIGRRGGERHEVDLAEHRRIEEAFGDIIRDADAEVFGAAG